MSDSAVIALTLRAGARLRDKLIVLSLDAPHDPTEVDIIAADVALARSLGAGVITVVTGGAGPDPLDALGPALRLLAAFERQGERAATLPAASIVTVHRIPLAGAGADVPSMIPVVSTAILVHLSALGYLPILFTPAVEAGGAALAVGTSTVAAFVAQFMSAALVLVPRGDELLVRPRANAGLPPMPAVAAMGQASPGRLMADMLDALALSPPPARVVDAQAELPLAPSR